ncbi:putative nucleobase-ascorbate transporter 10 [Glycine soja]
MTCFFSLYNMAEGSEHAGAGGRGGGNSQSQVIQVPEPEPHPVMEQLPDVHYCINSPPPWPQALLLGFQHYILTLGMTVLIPTVIVPEMGGGHAEKAKVIQNLLFVSGLSTLLQTWFGTRLPTVVVGSYSYIIPTMSIVHAKRYSNYTDPYERFTHTIRGIQGALIISSIFHVCMGFLGIWRFAIRFLSPLSVVPYVTFTGLSLYHLGFPMLAKCVEVGLPALIVMYLNHFVSTKRLIMYERFALLFSIASAWLLAQLLTSSTAYNHKPESTQNSCRTDRAGLISGSEWFHLPLVPFPWGVPTFNFGEALAMIAASFVSLFESTGTFYAAARYGSGTPVPPHVVSRGTGWVGVASLVNGFVGSVTGCTASVENAGLLALTKAGSRRVIQISAGFMIFFSIAGKLGAVLASIPLPIIAAMNCIFFGYFCNLNSFRTKFVLGLSFFLGISIPQYFIEYFHVKHHHGWFNDIVSVIFMSHTTVAALVAFILDITLSREDDAVRKDIGLQWWEKFSVYNADGRNADFYKLPCRLNEFFPAL